jgi:lipopolysaccharide biosynthesis glycosyltransferase
MKTLCYTIADFKPFVTEAIELLYQSLLINNDESLFDFIVLSSNNNPSKFELTTIVDASNLFGYVGFLKYSPLLPTNYDRYIYLDCDILYFGSIEKLFDKDKITIVTEPGSKMSGEWWSYNKSNSNTKELCNNTSGINAGTYCFYNKDIDFLSEIRNLCFSNIKSSFIENAQSEQGIYNYVLGKRCNFNLSCYYDITDIVQLHAAASSITKNKTLYHFCDCTISMANKYNSMENFYDQYKRINS